MKRAALLLLHNCVAHPLAGLAWAAGFTRAGDVIHGWWSRCFDDPGPALTSK